MKLIGWWYASGLVMLVNSRRVATTLDHKEVPSLLHFSSLLVLQDKKEEVLQRGMGSGSQRH